MYVEILKEKLAVARQKQQEKYNQFLEENGTAMKEMNDQLEKELNKSDEHDNKPKSKGESLFTDRDYFPLMGGGSGGSSYKPVKKRPCGPCGGGGCG